MDDFDSIGKEVMKSIVEYNVLLKSIEFELKISGGWLKPIRLKQLTGVLAQNRVEKWFEENKKKHKNFIVRNKLKTEVMGPEDWRFYFSEDELKAAYNRIALGEDEIENSSASGSDSDPSEDNLEEVKIQELPSPNKPKIKTEENPESLISGQPLSRAELKTSNNSKRPFQTNKKTRKSEQNFYPHTSRRTLNILDNTIRPQSSSKLIFHKDTRSGRTTPGLSPMIFKTFRKNFGFYQQMLSTKSQMTNGNLEIMCTKLLTKKQKYNK